MTIVELREKRAKLWATMEGFLDTHRNDKGVLSAEDDAVYANMEKELNDLTNEVRRMERRDAIAAELAKPVSSPITEQPQKAAGEAKTGRASGATERTSVCICAASVCFTMCSPRAWMPTAAISSLPSLRSSSWIRSRRKT